MEYNKLTQRLLLEGYTAEHYPKEVKLPGGVFGKSPLENIYGGFKYQRYYSDEFTYKTGCGKHTKGINVIDNMGFMGVEWCHENDNPIIRCPYDKADCELNNPLLHGTHGGGLCIRCYCECHQTEEVYDYENSIEKANKERYEEIERKYQEYSEKHHGRICRNHMYYNERTKEWRLDYAPQKCKSVCYSQNGFCPIRNKPIDKKKGNVYYDLKTSTIRKDGTLFDGEKIVSITKGIRFFDKSVSMDICKDFIKLQSDEIGKKYYWNKASTKKIWDKDFEFEILNIRAESRPSRDLMQDLADIREGILIVHESDRIKREKEAKRNAKKKRLEIKKQKIIRKVAKNGYDSLDYSEMKFISENDIGDEVEEAITKQEEAEKDKPIQMELSDFI